MKELKESDRNLIFDIPGRDSPGYLRRQRTVATFQKAINEKPDDPNTLNALVSYLVDFVLEPKDRKRAKALLWDLSKTEYDEMLNSLFTVPDAEVPPKS